MIDNVSRFGSRRVAAHSPLSQISDVEIKFYFVKFLCIDCYFLEMFLEQLLSARYNLIMLDKPAETSTLSYRDCDIRLQYLSQLSQYYVDQNKIA